MVQTFLGLDPARPLIKSGNAHRLDAGDARSVQVVHTNAGKYGETGRVGHVDFCVNGGRTQPYCSNATSKEEITVYRSKTIQQLE